MTGPCSRRCSREAVAVGAFMASTRSASSERELSHVWAADGGAPADGCRILRARRSLGRPNKGERAVETLAFILHILPIIGERTVEHVSIVGVAVGIAILSGVPIGIAITQSQRAADTILYLGSIVMTIPSIALFGVLIPILSKIGHGIGWLPAVLAAMLYAQLPIIRNTYTAIRNVDPALRSAAIGMGMSVAQRLARVEIPIALPLIIAGVRIAVVINIGVTAIAAYIGAGGLGTFISRGISQTDIRQLITGALALGLLAIVADYTLLLLQRRLTPKGLAPHSG